MKKWIFAAMALLLAAGIAGCGEKAPETQAPQDLLLVESKPLPAPTQESTRPPQTLPDFIVPQQETDPAPTVPETSRETLPAAGLPTITKEPTGETVAQGAEAWFVARARQAQTVCWQFLPPEDKAPLEPRQVAQQFPQLSLQGADSETLVLGNVPLELSGWSLQAQFTGEGGTVLSAPALLTVQPSLSQDQPMEAYGPVMENCRFMLQFDPARDSMETLGQNDSYQLYDGFDILGYGLGYTLLDVDGDGTQELLLGCTSEPMVYALFTQRNGSPVKVLQSWARNRYYYCGSNTFYQESSSGAGDSACCIHGLSGTGLNLRRALWSSSLYQEGVISFFYSMDGSMAENGGSQIPWEQYDRLSREMAQAKQPASLTLTPIE